MVFTGGVWQTGGGGGGKNMDGGDKKTGGGEKKTDRRRPPLLLEVQSDLVIHWLFRALIASKSCISI